MNCAWIANAIRKRGISWKIGVLSLMIILGLMTTIPYSAKASTQRPFNATLVTPQSPQDCERTWIEGGIFHARNCYQSGTITGDLSGTMILSVNFNLRAAGENGPQDGTDQVKGIITVGNEESYTISANALFQGGVLTGRTVILGVGSSKGTFIVGELTGISDGIVQISGTLLTTNT